jgi:hypothetical protein
MLINLFQRNAYDASVWIVWKVGTWLVWS